MQTVETATRPARFGWERVAGVVIWVTLIGAYIWYTTSNNLSPLQAVQALIQLIGGTWYGPLIYLAVYALRPLLLFPATLLTIAGGYIFGPLAGVLYTIIASNVSSLVAYLAGRFFGQGLVKTLGPLERYTERLRRNSFETVMTMRFLFLPYDLVSYVAGFLRISWVGFLLGTALGSIPGTIAFVLFGASIEGEFDGSLPAFSPLNFVIGLVMFVVSIGLSRWFRRREQTA